MGTVAVTGAASGIGAATAERLRAAGHDVISVDRHAADVVADLATSAGRRSAVEGVRAACAGRLDGLVTAAGVAAPRPVAEILAVNYFGSVELLDGLRDALASSGQGRAVAVTSVLSRLIQTAPALVTACLAGDEGAAQQCLDMLPDPTPERVYVATKVAVARWVRRQATRPEWAGTGIRLNAIAPGGVHTPLLEASGLFEALAPGLGDEHSGPPTGRRATPAEIAVWIETMVGPAAEVMCGSVVFVDGGADAAFRPDDWPTPPGFFKHARRLQEQDVRRRGWRDRLAGR